MTARKRQAKDTDLLFELPTQDEVDFETFLDEVGPGTATIEVFRYKRDGTRGQLDKVALDVLREDVYGFLRESYGPGKYWLVFKGADRRYKGSKILIVEDPKVRTDDTRAPIAGASNGTDPLIRDMLLAMIAAQKPAPVPDLGAMMTGLAAMLSAMKPSELPKPPDSAAMLTAVASVFATLRGPQKDEDWLERAKTIIGLAKDLSPDSNKEENFWSVAKDVGKEVITRLQIGGQPAGAVVEVPAIAAGQTVNVAPQQTQQEQTNVGGPSFQDWLRAGIRYLRDKAAHGKTVDWMIDRVLEDSEEPQWAAVIEAIQKGASFENLLQFEPSIGQNPELSAWFKQLYDGLYAEIHKSVDSTRARGDNGDASKNAGTSADGIKDAGSQ